MPGIARRMAMTGALAVALTQAGCASSSAGGSSEPRGDESVRITNQGARVATVDLTRNQVTTIDTLVVAASRAFAEVPTLFKVLGLPLARRDQVRGITVAAGQPRSIENELLSRYLICGRSVTAGPNADSYQVDLTVETQVLPVPGDAARATMKTTVRATAVPVSFSGNAVACESTGRLEQRMGELMRAKLANGGG